MRLGNLTQRLVAGIVVATLLATATLQASASAARCEDCPDGGGGGGGGTGGGGGAPPPPPPSCGNQRIIVRLVSVSSLDTEDLIWPGDELYFAGGGRATNGVATGLLTTPRQIGWGQSFTFDPTQSVAFDGVVRQSDTVTVGLEAHDEDFAKDWSKRSQVIDQIAGGIASGLVALGPYGIAGAAALGVGYFLVSYVDPDDLLANIGLSIPACGPGYQTGSRRFTQSDWYSGWDYTLDYEIIRTPA
jgi:hypothetical protein